MTEGSHCDVCGEVLVAQEVVDALGHTAVVDAAVDATCTATGLTEGSHCDVCGEVLVAQEEIAASGHSYNEAGVCTKCEEAVFIPKISGATNSYDVDSGVVTSTIQLGKSNVATITSPAGGWTLGEANTFTVASTNDIACVVIVKVGDTYTRLDATTEGTTHTFTLAADFDKDCEIIVAVKGDLNGNGRLDVQDARQALLASNAGIDKLNLLILDVNNNNRADVVDARRILLVSNGSSFDW